MPCPYASNDICDFAIKPKSEIYVKINPPYREPSKTLGTSYYRVVGNLTRKNTISGIQSAETPEKLRSKHPQTPPPPKKNSTRHKRRVVISPVPDNDCQSTEVFGTVSIETLYSVESLAGLQIACETPPLTLYNKLEFSNCGEKRESHTAGPEISSSSNPKRTAVIDPN